MAVDPQAMAQMLASGGGGAAGPAPGGEGMPPVAPPSGAPMPEPTTPEEAIQLLSMLGITDPQMAMTVMKAIELAMSGGGEAGPPIQGPGGQVPPPVA